MKTLRHILAFTAVACALFTAPIVAPGCTQAPLAKTGVYAGNTALYTTDSAITAAYAVLDAFMVFQMNNRASLPPEVNAFADKTRRDAPQWSSRLIALRDAYAASPTPESKAAMDTVLRLVREAVVQATAYLAPTT